MAAAGQLLGVQAEAAQALLPHPGTLSLLSLCCSAGTHPQFKSASTARTVGASLAARRF